MRSLAHLWHNLTCFHLIATTTLSLLLALSIGEFICWLYDCFLIMFCGSSDYANFVLNIVSLFVN